MIKHLLTFSHAFVRIVYVILVINHWMERPVRMSFMGKIVMSLFYVVGAFGWNNLPFKHSIYYWAKNFTLRFSYKHKLIEKKTSNPLSSLTDKISSVYVRRVSVNTLTFIIENFQFIAEHLQIPFQPQSKMLLMGSERHMYLVITGKWSFAT